MRPVEHSWSPHSGTELFNLVSRLPLDNGTSLKVECVTLSSSLREMKRQHAQRLREAYRELRARDAKVVEKDVKKSVAKYLDARGVFWWSNYIGPVILSGPGGKQIRVKNPMKGFPDLSGIVPNSGGRFFAIELKRPKGGVVSDEQRDWHADLKAQGVLVIIARHIDDVAGVL